MIYWTFDLLKNFRVSEVVLCVNYLANLLQEKIGNSYRDMKIIYSSENQPLGTAGPLRLAAEIVRLDKTFLAMNGDVITQVPLSKMLDSHENTNALVTDALHEVKDPSRFGVAELRRDQKIERFIEKPRLRETSSHLINAGIYLIEPEILDMIALGQNVSLEKQIFPILSKHGRLVGFPFDGLWFDIGNFEDYRKTNFALLRRRGKSFDKGSYVCSRSKTGGLVHIGENSKVDQNVTLGPLTVIGQNCVIAKNSRVSKSVLFDNVTVEEESLISGAILASNVKLGKRVTINPGCVLSPNVTIGDDVKVGRDVIIHPYKEIATNLKSKSHVL